MSAQCPADQYRSTFAILFHAAASDALQPKMMTEHKLRRRLCVFGASFAEIVCTSVAFLAAQMKRTVKKVERETRPGALYLQALPCIVFFRPSSFVSLLLRIQFCHHLLPFC